MKPASHLRCDSSLLTCRYVSSIIVMATYGYEFESDDDPRRAMIERVVKMTVEAGATGTALVDFMPFCECLRFLER